MKLTPDNLRRKNSLLTWNTDGEINDLISFLTEQGFVWLEKEQTLYSRRIDFYIKPEELKRFINDRELLKKELEFRGETKREEKKGINHPDNAKMATLLINILVVLMIVNFFLGWMIFHFVLWIFLELVIVFSLLSFIRVRKKIMATNTTNQDVT